MAILISEFPKETVRMVALMESMLGIGMILGPILGSVVYGEMNFMYACLFFSALNFLMIPVLYFLVGKLRDYDFLRKNPISLLDLVKKQVKNN
jgi:MFS family permease